MPTPDNGGAGVLLQDDPLPPHPDLVLNLPNHDLVLLHPGDLLGRVPDGGIGLAGGAGNGGLGVGDNVFLHGVGDGGGLDPVLDCCLKLDHFTKRPHT